MMNKKIKKFRKLVASFSFLGFILVTAVVLLFLWGDIFIEDLKVPLIWFSVNVFPITLFSISLYLFEKNLNTSLESSNSKITFRFLIFYFTLLLVTISLYPVLGYKPYIKIISNYSYIILLPAQIVSIVFLASCFYGWNILGYKKLKDELLDSDFQPISPQHLIPPIDEKKESELIVKMFLASSKELKTDRDQIEIFIRRENDRLRNNDIYLKLAIWEDFLDAMSITRLQDEYNKAVVDSNIFICLFGTKVGKFTEEEFNVAYNNFKVNGSPEFIFTFFKEVPITTATANLENLSNLRAFQKRVIDLGHFYSNYKNKDDLHLQLKNQLDKIYEKMLNLS